MRLTDEIMFKLALRVLDQAKKDLVVGFPTLRLFCEVVKREPWQYKKEVERLSRKPGAACPITCPRCNQLNLRCKC